ncbi:unnamed protein product, partial [Ascophyllum nodosum]
PPSPDVALDIASPGAAVTSPFWQARCDLHLSLDENAQEDAFFILFLQTVKQTHIHTHTHTRETRSTLCCLARSDHFSQQNINISVILLAKESQMEGWGVEVGG